MTVARIFHDHRQDSDSEVRRIVREVSGLDVFGDDERLVEDLSLYGDELAELRIALELRFHIEIEDGFGACRTAGDVLRLVEKATERRTT